MIVLAFHFLDFSLEQVSVGGIYEGPSNNREHCLMLIEAEPLMILQIEVSILHSVHNREPYRGLTNLRRKFMWVSVWLHL